MRPICCCRLTFKRLIIFSVLGFSIFVCASLAKEWFGNQSAVHNLHVSSLYYVKDSRSKHSRNIVRLLVLSQNGLANAELNCIIDYKKVPALVSGAYGPEYCRWRSYLVDCPAEHKPGSIFLGSDTTIKHQLQLTESDPTPRNLVVCFSPLYFYENWQILLATIELYRFYGADLLVIPLLSVVTRLYTILRSYERDGRVRIKSPVVAPMFLDLDYNPNAEVEYFNQALIQTECLYEYKESVKFILNVNVDEVLIPRSSDNLFQELMWLSGKYPNAGSFEFMGAEAMSRSSPLPAAYKISDTIKYGHIKNISTYGKRAIIPKRLHFAFNYDETMDEVVPRYEHQVLSENDSLVVHFKFLSDEKANTQSGNAYFAANDSTYDLLDSSFNTFLAEHHFAKLAFNILHEQSGYLKRIKDFHQNMLMELSKESPNKCPSPMSFLLAYGKQIENNKAFVNSDKKEDPLLEPQQYAPCVIIKNRYALTPLSSTVKVSSVEFADFVPSSSCVFW